MLSSVVSQKRGDEVYFLSPDALFKGLVIENLRGVNLPEDYVSPKGDDVTRLPSPLKENIIKLTHIIGLIKAEHIKLHVTSLIPDLFEKPIQVAAKEFQKFKRQQDKKTKKKTWTYEKTELYFLMKNLIGTLNFFEYQLQKSENPHYIDIISQFVNVFETLITELEEAGLDKTSVHETLQGSLVKCQYFLCDQMLVEAEKSKDAYQPTLSALLRRNTALSCQQNLELLISLSESKENQEKRILKYKDNISDALVETELSLGFLKMAGKRINASYHSRKNHSIVTMCSVTKMINYVIFMSESSNPELHAREVVLNSKRALLELNTKKLVSTGGRVPDDFLEHYTKALHYLSAEALPHYHRVLDLHIQEAAISACYDKETDALIVEFANMPEKLSKNLSQFIQKTLSNVCTYAINRNGLDVMCMLEVSDKKLKILLHELLPKVELSISGAYQKNQSKAFAKAAKLEKIKLEQEACMQEAEEALKNLSLEQEKFDLKSEDTRSYAPIVREQPQKFQPNEVKKESPKVQIGSSKALTIEPKKKEKRFRESEPSPTAAMLPVLEPLKPRFYDAKKLKLKSKELIESGVTFLKLHNAVGIFVGFRETFALGKGKEPDAEILHRFRESICQYPVKVGPVNQNGFKWLSCESQPEPILVGKLKSLPWRLLPQATEVNEDGKTIILYGTVKNTKKGKITERYR